jgi:lipooligosaccharide transport system ATP-binding protein
MEEAFQICDRIIIMDEGRKILEGEPQQLLSANLEMYVMEIYGTSGAMLTSAFLNSWPGIRSESYQETLFIYSNDADELSAAAEALHISGYHIRQSNLEDLFLKVTGRGLNELQ